MIFQNDVINKITGIKNNTDLDRLRKNRPLVVNATQDSLTALFSDQIKDISLEERAYVAIYIAYLTKQTSLADFYHNQFTDLLPDIISLIQQNEINKITDQRIQTILKFTHQVTLVPVSGNEAILNDLQRVGLSNEAIVILTQLIGFISYQLRVIAGLNALQQFTK